MKKIMIAAGAVALCGAVLADVTSANIVGYQTITAPAAGHYVSLSVQFEPVDGVQKTVNTLFTYATGTPKGTPGFGNSADNLWLWDPTLNDGAGNWAKYWYKSTGTKGFYRQGATATPSTDVVPAGSTILFFRGLSAGAATLTLSGGVVPLKSAVQQTGLAAGKYRFMCYPWPIDFNINQLAACQKAPKGTPGFGNSADNVWIWDPTLNDGAGNWAKFWYKSTGTKGYYRQGVTSAPADYKIPAGEGFLFFRGLSGAEETITFKGPEYVEE